MTKDELSARYKDTVLLPQTSFSMKANLAQNEPLRIQKWMDQETHKKMVDRRAQAPRFVMPDGPPYANGNIHVGHALNKILKDIIIKYRAMAGYQAAFIPGWDCHGLPIELNVTKKLGPKKSETSPEELRNLCREEAMSWVHRQREQFKRLGVLADWDHPYLTLAPAYEADEVRVLAKIQRRGLLYRGVKPVYWDCALQTALAAAEVEYHSHKSLSVYVRFELTPDSRKQIASNLDDLSVVIWTTTPWTLPANHGICLHPEFKYGVFKSERGNLLIALDLSEHFTKETGLSLQLIKEFPGAALEHLLAQHPFMNRTSRLILGNHVTLEAGTGCVHTAPGHGPDDYNVGLRYKLPIDSPVDAAGKFTRDVPAWQGESIWEANPKVVESLRASGHLLASTEIEHQYPYGPRSKKPLIFRATAQWFVRMDDLQNNVRQQALNAAQSSIGFVPSWGSQRLVAMISNSPDWCLSRQRLWGVPIPVFYCTKCDEPLVNADVMELVAAKMEQSGRGIEAYHATPANEFTQGYKCACGHDEFRHGQDILDVWFDSGVCHTAVQKRRVELGFPADIYIEGSDQHRGWFQTSLISSLAATGEVPFKSLVTHGFVNDAQGLKMSKSQGNVIDPEIVIKESGAEILRLWAAHEDFGDDLTISKEMLTRISDTYRRFRNTFRFLLGNLHDFSPDTDRVEFGAMPELERWLLHRCHEVTTSVNQAYDRYEFYRVYHQLNQFFTIDLSAIYLDIRKDLLYTGKKNGVPRKSTQTVCWILAKSLAQMLAPIASFLAEEVMEYLPGNSGESVFLSNMAQGEREWLNPELAAAMQKVFAIRAEASKILEEKRREKVIGASLEAQLLIEAPRSDLDVLKARPNLADLFIVSQVTLKEASSLRVEVQRAAGEKCIRCWRFDEQTNSHAAWPGICPKCVEALS